MKIGGQSCGFKTELPGLKCWGQQHEVGWKSVSNSISQGSIPGPVLFNSINYFDNGTGYAFSKFADDRTVEGVIHQVVAPPFSRGWRSGLAGISQSVTKGNAKSYITGGITQYISTGWRPASWKAVF